MGDAAMDDSGATENENVSQLAPVFIVTVDDQRDVGILGDVFQPFELAGSCAFGFLVDRRKELGAVEDEADWDDVGLPGFIRGGEMGDASGTDQAPGA